MIREEAAEIYLDGLLLKNVEIGRFFDAANVLSNEDKVKIQDAVEKYRINFEATQRKEVMKDKCLVL